MSIKRDLRKRKEAKQKLSRQLDQNKRLNETIKALGLQPFHDAQKVTFRETIRETLQVPRLEAIAMDQHKLTLRAVADLNKIVVDNPEAATHIFAVNYIYMARSWIKEHNIDGWSQILNDIYADALDGFVDLMNQYIKIGINNSMPDLGYVLIDTAIPAMGENGGIRPQHVKVHTIPAETAKVTIDNKTRPVYRMGHIQRDCLQDKLTWTSMQPEQFKLKGDKPLPVYIQEHAIRRLAERINDYRGGLSRILEQSVASGELQRYNHTRLIPFRIAPDLPQLGYFVIEPKEIIHEIDRHNSTTEQGLLITTFLFITMEGTPEGDKLRRELRLHKADIDYYGLDKLSGFTTTDLTDHPEAVKIFQRVGLGDLIKDIRERQFVDNPRREVAADLAKYLGQHS